MGETFFDTRFLLVTAQASIGTCLWHCLHLHTIGAFTASTAPPAGSTTSKVPSTSLDGFSFFASRTEGPAFSGEGGPATPGAGAAATPGEEESAPPADIADKRHEGSGDSGELRLQQRWLEF